MSGINRLSLAFREIQDALRELSDADLDKLVSGDYQISLKLVKRKSSINNKHNTLSLNKFESILGLLEKCDSREDGAEILSKELKNKIDFEMFARYAEVAVMKSDKVDKIRDNIIESTIGAKLRSVAIQNKG